MIRKLVILLRPSLVLKLWIFFLIPMDSLMRRNWREGVSLLILGLLLASCFMLWKMKLVSLSLLTLLTLMDFYSMESKYFSFFLHQIILTKFSKLSTSCHWAQSAAARWWRKWRLWIRPRGCTRRPTFDLIYIFEWVFGNDVPVGHCSQQTKNIVHGIEIPVDLAQWVNGTITQKRSLIVHGGVLLNRPIVLCFDEGVVDCIEYAS